MATTSIDPPSSNNGHHHHNTMNRRTSESKRTQRIQNYVIYKKTLGAGSMGKVKLAQCISDTDHKQYAVKIIPKADLTAPPPENTKDPKDTPKEREQRARREMAMMYLLHHPNICQLKEWITENDRHYMFLEYIDGGQLLDYIISHGKLREKQARKFSRQIVSALDYCHRNSIVHRDLKIENILITKEEEIKIIDFGLSNIYSPLRLLNTFCGSLYFAAPELLRAKDYTGPEVDVWSFGVVLYVLVCGRVPFDDTSLPALHAKIKAGSVEYPEHLSRDCVDLLSHILVVDPKRRETLTYVRNHPWINKGYDEPVTNHLPHRRPLQHIDMDIVEGMRGFGLGDARTIHDKLVRIISSPEYQEAAAQIDHNYQTTLQGQQTGSRWRRGPVKNACSRQDDPQSLPAMYDPLVSIYYLVKERKEMDERMQMMAGQLGRSNSTRINRPKFDTTTLMRRKTEHVPRSSARLEEEDLHSKVDSRGGKTEEGSPTTTSTSSGAAATGSTPFRRTLSLLRARSISDRKSRCNQEENSQQQQQQQQQPQPSEEHGSSTVERAEIMPSMGAHPKSLFNFNRRHLFKLQPNEMMMHLMDVLSLLNIDAVADGPFTLVCSCGYPEWTQFLQSVENESSSQEAVETMADSRLIDGEPLRFTTMIYQARWAGGRLGVKVEEAEDEVVSNVPRTKIYRNIYHTILYELGKKIQKT
ncbi:serine/threonine-protein kinase KIN2 [Apophysomyces ossiformis]|uniref:Serine/threonine-protein kinase KIN2 n=1 Tax=Apophysomyces ossiformis TaxID=679940 RepID=A0A8H7ES76_9FUNG|nr:serine/threonine-protein kinase KIN2 [Apophysomyces ossiformis]